MGNKMGGSIFVSPPPPPLFGPFLAVRLSGSTLSKCAKYVITGSNLQRFCMFLKVPGAGARQPQLDTKTSNTNIQQCGREPTRNNDWQRQRSQLRSSCLVLS